MGANVGEKSVRHSKKEILDHLDIVTEAYDAMEAENKELRRTVDEHNHLKEHLKRLGEGRSPVTLFPVTTKTMNGNTGTNVWIW